MNHKTYFLISATVFLAGAIVHVMHLLGGWKFALGNFILPIWMSVAAVVLAGSLSCIGFRFALKEDLGENKENRG